MKNYIGKSGLITLVAPTTVHSGVPFIVGGFVGLPESDAQQGELVSVLTEGVITLTTTVDVNLGDILYLKSDGTVVKTASGNTALGFALQAGAANTEIEIMLNKTIPSPSSAPPDLSPYLQKSAFNQTLIAACSDAAVKTALKAAVQ